ncbi:MAG: LapA family protein [Synergistaceae bacterium]|nr:LapA family protein [Synergistaceae bacterium]
MKSYFLCFLVLMVLSAVYTISNTADVTVRFFTIEKVFSQGLWEILLFLSGALIMWLFSVGAEIEVYRENRKKARELARKVKELEDEKHALLVTLQRLGGAADPTPAIQDAGIDPKTSKETAPQALPAVSEDSQRLEQKSGDKHAKPALSDFFAKFFGKSNPPAAAPAESREPQSQPDAETSGKPQESLDGDTARRPEDEGETSVSEEPAEDEKETASV